MIGDVAAALALVVGSQIAAPPFAERAALTLEVTEELQPDELIPVRRVSSIIPRVITRSNMLPEGLLDAIARFPSSQAVLRLPLVKAHLEQFERRLNIGVIVECGAAPLDSVAIGQLQRLGPRPLRIRLDSVDEARSILLSRLGPIEVEVDIRHRELTGEEAGALLRLYRARRVIRLEGSAKADAIRGLAVLRPLTLVIEVPPEGRVEDPTLAAARELGVPIVFRFPRLPQREQVAKLLGGLHAAVELAPTNNSEMAPEAMALIRALGPAEIEERP